MTLRPSFAARLTGAMALLLLVFGAAVALLAQRLADDHAQEAQQRLAHGLARHIVDQWPHLNGPDGGPREGLIGMLRVVNPGVQVYLLDADGQVRDYLGDAAMVRNPRVDLATVRAFLAGGTLPLRGTDPMGSDRPRIFSAAMFPAGAGSDVSPGYLYIVLDAGPALPPAHVWSVALAVAGAALLGTALLGAGLFRRLTMPLRRLAARMHGYGAQAQAPRPMADEVRALEIAFDELTARIDAQAAHERRQAREYRETMAGVAHDLRTPLTALHGQIEALNTHAALDPAQRGRLLHSALAQSDKLRRLTQQLFELAALQDAPPATPRERFRLDELVNDTVLQLADQAGMPTVELLGPAPAAVEVEGDVQLMERALTNLIDNARRHAGAVQVRLERAGRQVRVLVQDRGPGLPALLHQRLQSGQSLREPPLGRPGGGIGGLGLAIAQRVAELHGGSLRPLPSPGGGTCLCLALPVAG